MIIVIIIALIIIAILIFIAVKVGNPQTATTAVSNTPITNTQVVT